MCGEVKELRDNAKTTVTWTIFWAIIGMLVVINSSIIGFIVKEKNDAHDKIDDRLTTLEAKEQDSRVNYATIQTQLAQIQKDLAELKIAVNQRQK